MSFQAMSWAVDKKLPTNQKMALLMLANRTNHDTGRCDPSHKRLAEDCGMSVSTLKRCIKQLEEQGLLKVITRKNGDVNLPNQYVLNLDWVGSERTDRDDNDLTVGSERTEGVGSERPTKQELYNQEDKQDPKPSEKPVLDEENIIAVWNELGCQKHKGLTKNATNAILKTYSEYLKGNDDPMDINDWVISYLKNGFAKWMTTHHRNMGDGQWCADLEFAMRFSTYDKVKNAELE